MREVSKRRWKSIRKCFEEKAEWHSKKQVKFQHRAPSGDARKKESVIKMMARNVNRIIIVASLKFPSLKPGLIDRFLVMAEIEKITPVIVFNKVDLENDRVTVNKLLTMYNSLGYKAMVTSAVTGEGLDDLRSVVRGKRSALAGHSGVGKSSLLNAIHPGLPDRPETSEISMATGKGRHTTTTVKLYRPDDDTEIFDLPGLKYASLHNLEPVELARCFPEFEAYSYGCWYMDCLHRNEPRCAVREAVQKGNISKERYESYIRILAAI